MVHFLPHAVHGWSLADYFDSLRPGKSTDEMDRFGWIFRYRIAMALDDSDAETLARLREIVCGDSEKGVINHTVIRAMLLSRNTEAHTLVAGLLRAAKLQEGLRQSVFEAMDECSEEGFLAILDVMIAEGMERFSSAIRAVQTWTGLHLKAEKPATVKKAFHLIRDLLRVPGAIADSLKSDNALEIYLALWAIAFREIGDTREPLITLAKSCIAYKRFAAFCFAAGTQDAVLKKELILASLDDRSPEAWALLLPLVNDVLLATAKTLGMHCPAIALNHLYLQIGNALVRVSAETARNRLRQQLLEMQPLLPAAPDELRQIFDAVADMVPRMPKGKSKVAHGPFAEYDFRITPAEMQELLLVLAIFLPEEMQPEVFAAVHALLPKFSANMRAEFVGVMLSPNVPKQREMLWGYFLGTADTTRAEAAEKFAATKLTPEEFLRVESAMKFTSWDARFHTNQLLLRQPPADIMATLRRAMADRRESVRQSGLNLAESILRSAKEKNSPCKEIAAECQAFLDSLAEAPPPEERKALQRLTQAVPPEYDFKTGLGLCDIRGYFDFPPPDDGPLSLREFIEAGIPRAREILKALSNLVHEHRDYEYPGYYHSWDEPAMNCVLGTLEYGMKFTMPAENLKQLAGHKIRLPEDLPLPDVWRDFFAEQNLSPGDFLLLDYLGRFYEDWEIGYSHLYTPRVSQSYKAWFREWYETVCCPRKKLKEFHEFCKSLPYGRLVSDIVQAYSDAQLEPCAPLLASLLGNMYHSLDDDNFAKLPHADKDHEKDKRFDFLTLRFDFYDFFFTKYSMAADGDFAKKFPLLYKFFQLSAMRATYMLRIEDFGKAREAGYVDDAELYRQLLYRRESKEYFRRANELYEQNRLHDFPHLRRVLAGVVDRLMTVLFKADEYKVHVPGMISDVRYFEGLKYFAGLLRLQGNQPFLRMSLSETRRSTSVCSLIRCCHPSDEDKQRDKFPELDGFDEKRLVEAAMYAPQWAGIIEKHTGWAGLAGGCWFFHAHVNEEMPERKQDVVARFSPISPGRFKDGVLDMRWFREVYAELGPERFQSLHDAAKYIGAGANHRRIQIMTDAVLGKLERGDVLEKIREKRNKDYVLAFGLMPLTEAGEAFARYDVLQTFLRQSKQFGPQRRESERKTVAIAMENLAQNAGFADANRFAWNMETRRSEALLAYFQPQTVEDTELSLALDEKGMPAISVVKNGKPQAAIPAKLRKHAVAEELRQAQKDLREQFSQVRASLERCMETEAVFEPAELVNLAANPVIRPMFEKLVFFRGSDFGFWRDGVLTGIASSVKLKETDRVRIAHPAHLHAAGVWRAAQEAVFSREIIQPFKQVFRELYLPNADEKANGLFTQRYAGHQVQPAKTLALLQSRGWAIHAWEGLMKVFHDLEIVAELYCYADWFMPSDIEPPTLERVVFTDRRTREPIALEKIPPVFFSEVMRDLDLVVSVAHVGGVDPEASLSTVEMRAAILTETLRLLRLANVTMKKNHALIRGTLGEYTVHLGSGLVQQMAHGSLTIMPVHSQRRGRLFLPFIDDDPKTAEILTKVILLAEDEKLKDPTILDQIKK